MLTREPQDGYGNPDSLLFSHRVLDEEMEAYRRLLNAAIPAYVFGKARQRIMKAAEEYAWARARERYAAISERSDVLQGLAQLGSAVHQPFCLTRLGKQYGCTCGLKDTVDLYRGR